MEGIKRSYEIILLHSVFPCADLKEAGCVSEAAPVGGGGLKSLLDTYEL